MILPGQSILRELGVEGCDVAELEHVIGCRFKSWGGDRHDRRALLFPHVQEAYAIKLAYDAKHRLKDALAGPALDDEQLADIASQIKRDLLGTGIPKVGNWVLFGAVPVTGAYRYGEEFQVLPVPDHAPRPNCVLADHPFLLQFKYEGSPNGFVDQRRRACRGRELELLLVGLVSSHIHSPRQTLSSQWVLPASGAGVQPTSIREPESVLCQVSYMYAGMNGVIAEFTPIANHARLAVVSASEFHSRTGIRTDQLLDLPEYLEWALSAYESLDADRKLKFGNACYWLQYAMRTYVESRSASYIALILAIESVMPPPALGAECGSCGRHTGKGPTQQFKEFLNQFAPGTGPFEAGIKHLYEIRSKLAHGRALLFSDRGHLLAPMLASFEDWQAQNNLHHLVRAALVNWLGKRAEVSSGTQGE